MQAQFLANISPSVLGHVKNLSLDIRSESCNEAVNELLKRTVLLGGKRLRPMLTYIFGELFGVSKNELEVFSRAIECVHAASLSHDDVVDNATTRRGKPSINALATNKKAVLAGDYLLADVIVELTQTGHLDLVREMSLIIKDLAEGEWIQLDCANKREYSRDIIETIALKKTSSVMTWCCMVAAYLSGQDKETIELCRKIGKHLGLAFQQMDDTLDFSKDSLKDENLDLENEMVNSVVFEWLELHPNKKQDYLKGESLQSLLSNASMEGAVEKVTQTAHGHLDVCLDTLAKIELKLQGQNIKTFIKAKKSIVFILDYLGKRKS